ncbi:hypothetical protein ERO13_A09G108632v2 [Gossypium hirsutum]|uniref:60S ribosomal protein L7-2 n=2 Tax=Gossypium TaxID=3633 RepID=A0A1U8HT25_GOSHI|nr:60S ribosomal protein L7-2-like [Gossypium hirsutum]KAG4183415.1 hypothetical protein ERO13_A09G108632v2 [Gossypium hirsutum]TYH02372.1 hypothetical protein ES288_A09G135800v1 [Gossypium darwinii]
MQHAKEYEAQEKELIQLKREAKLKGGFYVNPESKLLFIIRVRGINAMRPRTRKILQLLRLRQIFNGAFLKVNKATMNMLHLVEPHVTYGYPNPKIVRELIYKRSYGKLNKQRVALTDDAIIEQVCIIFHLRFHAGDEHLISMPVAFTGERLWVNSASSVWKTLSMRS